ncbi:MAG: hypothetical protein ACXWRE_05160, partial [Pseudobdellovibrionaceae bacterium]
MSFFAILVLAFFFCSAHATEPSSLEGTSVTGVGALLPGTSVHLEPVDTSKTYFGSSPAVAKEEFPRLDSASLYRVQSFTNPPAINANTDNQINTQLNTLQALASQGNLLVQEETLKASSPNCVVFNGPATCSLQNELPVYQAGLFDFAGLFSNIAQSSPPSSPQPRLRQSDEEVVHALDKSIKKVNSKTSANQKKILSSCDEENDSFPSKEKISSCGLQQALQAYNANKSRLHKDIIVLNDFSDGTLRGKMWFLRPDGTPANILAQNPISVVRGPGGFGSGKGTLKTPQGALLTLPYRPPRNGNVKDGIELEGLESENRDTYKRGILLHGWNTYTPTEGCLGVAGTLDTRAHGERTLGLPPYYLDELKKNL